MKTCTFLAPFLAVACISGCASRGDTAQWRPTCRTVGCVERVHLDAAGEGSTVSFVDCREGGRQEHRYTRIANAWTLTLYESKAAPECGTARPRD